MIYIDIHEPISIELYLNQCMQVERTLLNRPAIPSRPDYGFLDWQGKWYGVSRKQAGEFLGGLDATEAQLLEEMGGCDYMALLIEGWITPAEDGGAWSWAISVNPHIAYQNRHYSQNYKGVRQKLASLHDKGILILQTANELDTAMALVALYDESQRPEGERRTLNRLIKQKTWITETDPVRRAFMLTVTHVEGGGWEEETADAAATWMTEREVPLTLVALIHCLKKWPGQMEKALMRSSTKEGARQMTIGPARVAKMRRALGV